MNSLDLYALLGECIGQESGLRDDLRERLSVARREMMNAPDATIPKALLRTVRNTSDSRQPASWHVRWRRLAGLCEWCGDNTPDHLDGLTLVCSNCRTRYARELREIEGA